MAVGALFAVAVAFLTTVSFFGNADDKDRQGRWLRLPDLSGDPRAGGWSLLWPGAYYALPLLAALGLTLLMSGIALNRIADRPRIPTAIHDPVDADERTRRRSAAVVVAAVGVAAGAALCGAGLVAASGLTGAGAPWNVLGIALWAVVAAAAAIGAWSVGVLLTPGPVHRTVRSPSHRDRGPDLRDRPRRPDTPYAQLRRSLATMIERGTLADGQRLPTVRQLAGDLGVAAGTVMRAYKELEAAGYVRGDRRRGTVVTAARHRPPDTTADLAELAADYCRRARALGADPEQTLAAVARALEVVVPTART